MTLLAAALFGYSPPPKFKLGDKVFVSYASRPEKWLGEIVGGKRSQKEYIYDVEQCLPGHPRTVSEWESNLRLVPPDEVGRLILEMSRDKNP